MPTFGQTGKQPARLALVWRIEIPPISVTG